MNDMLMLFASLALMAALVILLYTAIEAFGKWLLRRYGKEVEK